MIVILVQQSYLEWGGMLQTLIGIQVFGKAWVDWLALGSMWVTVVLTFWSGGLYLWRNRAI